jgi:hypothetical protein
MRFYRFALNIWITLASLLSFLLGWVILAHAPKPVQPVQAAAISVPALPTLQPLPDLQFGSGNTFQNFQVPSNNFQSNPAPVTVFRTGGS